MPIWFDPPELECLEAVVDRLIPPDEHCPGASAAGVADYIDGLLGAFSFDPPRIWAGGPFSGRHGGEDGFEQFLELGTIEQLAWRIRLEGSGGLAEREFNGPVVGLQQEVTDALGILGVDFADLDLTEQDERLDAQPAAKRLLYSLACEGMYGDPAYGGNRDLVGWRSIGFEGDAQPRGWTDVEVSTR
ncbi:MAG: gluconate 2-dehydrogenase subunit 3 family protein [Acidobacteria bacterium]|nr:gluconate 2-dehydrogenase subunit 3 family protein [Acidobacteriota bacterium]